MNQASNMQFTGITRDVYDASEFVFANRFVNAMHEGVNRYPIVRTLRFAARVELEALLDAIALDPAWRVERTSVNDLVIDGDGVFITGYGGRKADYSSCSFCIWAADIGRAEQAKQRLLDKAGSTRITEPMFSIDWHFLTSR